MPALDPDRGVQPEAAPPRSLGEAHRQLAARFAAAGLDTPALDARLLVTGALHVEAAEAIRNPERPLDAAALALIETFANRRLAREPVSRILGLRPFYGLDLEIGPATLDPRPDTETLVDMVLQLVQEGRTTGGSTPRILDLGTGSGAIVIALLLALPGASGVATDIAPEALAIARRNARRHDVTDRLETVDTSWLDGIAGPFDVIVSNPPYIPSAVIAGLEPEVQHHDPKAALDGGLDGLDAYRVLVPAVGPALSPGGWLALEIGLGQDVDVARIAATCPAFGPNPKLLHRCDLAGHVRCVAVQARQ